MECFILPAAAQCVYHNLLGGGAEGAGLDYLPKVGGYFLNAPTFSRQSGALLSLAQLFIETLF